MAESAAERLVVMRHDRLELSGPGAAAPTERLDGKQAEIRESGVWSPHRVVQALRIVLCAGAFAGFGLGGWLLAWVALPLLRFWPGTGFEKRRRCQRVVRWAWVFFHDYMRVAGLVNFDHRTTALPIQHPAVIVSNHPTLVDITALVAAVGPVCFVAKKPLFRNPVFGPLLRACGHICGGVGKDASNGGALDQALARLAEGHSVLLFPEGTRSPAGGMNRFRLGAFELARRARVPLIVIHVDARPLALYKGVPWYAIPRVAMRLQLCHVNTFSDWAAVPDVSGLCALRDRTRDVLVARCQAVQVAAAEAPAVVASAPLLDMQEEFR